MEFARVHDYVVVTHDLDFGAILASTGRDKPSVIQIRSDDLTPERLAPSIIDALRQMAEPLQAGALLTVDPARARLRLLPLSRA
jgi:predicted nuclease of predicted toxin-antitoxin system